MNKPPQRIHVMLIQKIANFSMYASMANNQDVMDARWAKHSTMLENVVNGLAKSPNGNSFHENAQSNLSSAHLT